MPKRERVLNNNRLKEYKAIEKIVKRAAASIDEYIKKDLRLSTRLNFN